MRQIVPPSFYGRDPALVAPELLGKYIVRLYTGEFLVGMITETEAYLPFDDEASHGFKRTKSRNSLYKRGGHAYVYGLRHHFLFNAVTEDETRPGAVLIRAFEPVEGLQTMLKLRNKTDFKNLSNGPGKVTQALGINRTLDGIDLSLRDGGLYIEDRGTVIERTRIQIRKRIGITKAVDLPLRFLIDGRSLQ